MDESVLAALAKWPNVPDVYGWLSLTARGQWRLRGEPIANPAIRDFIGRNYAADAQGRWYFQNGPQRVYVALERAPWVFRLQPDGGLRTFTGLAPRRLRAAALVDGASFVLLTDLGAGNVDDRDVERFLAALEDQQGRGLDDAALDRVLGGEQPLYVAGARCGLGDARVPLQRLAADELERAFGFVAVPAGD
jgi:hypothetical protein